MAILRSGGPRVGAQPRRRCPTRRAAASSTSIVTTSGCDVVDLVQRVLAVDGLDHLEALELEVDA